jgi:hypothetical protein
MVNPIQTAGVPGLVGPMGAPSGLGDAGGAAKKGTSLSDILIDS